jgi:nitrogen fixation NifU-like protein
MSLEDLYREVILDHYRTPRNKGHLDAPNAKAQGINPLCGDDITIELMLDGDKVESVAIDGQGCSISLSSASMMSEAIKGKSRAEIEELTAKFRGLMSLEDGIDPGVDHDHPGSALGDLESLEGVRKYPVRIKCASLAWNVLAEALAQE